MYIYIIIYTYVYIYIYIHICIYIYIYVPSEAGTTRDTARCHGRRHGGDVAVRLDLGTECGVAVPRGQGAKIRGGSGTVD